MLSPGIREIFTVREKKAGAVIGALIRIFTGEAEIVGRRRPDAENLPYRFRSLPERSEISFKVRSKAKV